MPALRSLRAWLRASPSARDLRALAEALGVIVGTWVLLGWTFDHAITQADGTVSWVPYMQSELAGGVGWWPSWSDHLYRFGVLGGAPMQPSGGALPLVELCGALGLSATDAANLLTVFLQLAFASFGLEVTTALVASSAADGDGRSGLSGPERLATIWACAFAPILGWRLALGHENLVLGLLPLLAAAGAVAAARRAPPSPVGLGFAAFTVATGLSGLSAQTVVYGALFGAPALAALALEPRGGGPRWGRSQALVVAALLAGVLVTLPRLWSMLAHALGDDFARGGAAGPLTYSLGAASWRDWLSGLPWTTAVARAVTSSPLALHERNLPVGPLALLVVAAWPTTAPRWIRRGLLAGALLALILADDVAPLSTALIRIIPPLAAFRVPTRALLPILIFVPPLGLAALWTTVRAIAAAAPAPAPASARGARLAVAAAAALIAAGRWLPPLVTEPAAWVGTLLAILIARGRPAWATARHLTALGVVLAALGVAAFAERFPRDLTFTPIEGAPRALRAAVLAQAPELAMPLNRLQIVDAPPPYEMSTAFAAGLPSLDGAWHPTRRFLALLGALRGKPIDPTTMVFKLTRTAMFPALQQLYNVRYVARLGAGGGLTPQPPTPGPAWFPRHVASAADPAEVGRALTTAPDLRATLTETGWLVATDAVPGDGLPTTCAGATVGDVRTDARGQAATIAVTVAAPCVLVVATNYSQALHAASSGAGAPRDLRVFPIDVALTGILVPPGTTTVTLAPVADVPGWAAAGALGGVALLLAALAVAGFPPGRRAR
jgi:hypothetical protein